MHTAQRVGAMMLAVAMLLSACGDDATAEAAGQSDRPVVIATTNILGDVLDNLVGEQLEVVTVMPVGADPHDFQPSARDVAVIEDASAIISNGAAFEEGLLDVVEAAESNGVPAFEAISAVEQLEFGGDAHKAHDDEDHEDEDHGDEDHDDEDHDDEDHEDEDHDDEDHDDEDHDDEDHDEHGDEDHDDEDHEDHGHGAGSTDPHFFTDPARMAIAADAIVDFLIANIDTVDGEALRAEASGYLETLTSLDQEVEALLESVPASNRSLVTNHEVFSYFADRYDFQVVGTVIPGAASAEGVSGRRLVELAEVLEREGVSAVFTDSSSSSDLARTLADEVGDVAVVSLFTESLGAADTTGATYVDMVRSNAELIAEALGS